MELARPKLYYLVSGVLGTVSVRAARHLVSWLGGVSLFNVVNLSALVSLGSG